MSSRKNKSQYLSGSGRQHRRRPAYLRCPTRGMQAVFATCQRTHESRCARELLDLIGDLLDEFWGNDRDEGDSDHDGSMSVEDALQRERLQLMNKADSRVIQLDVGGVAGMVLIQIIDYQIDVIELVRRAFDSLQKSNRPLTRYVERLMPIQYVFRATPADLESVVPDFVPAQFESRPATESFCCMTETRCNDLLERTKAITTIAAGVVPESRPVNLNDPDVIVMLQVIKNVAGLSCVSRHDYDHCHKWKWRSRSESLLLRANQ